MITKKIVKDYRTWLLVSDENGEISKYQLVETSKLKTKKIPAKSMPRAVRKPTVKPKPKQSISQAMATLPQCSVAVERLSEEDIAIKMANIKRSGEIRAIKEKLGKLPRRNFFSLQFIQIQLEYNFFFIGSEFLRAATIVEMNEPHMKIDTDIIFELVSDHTLSLLYEFVFINVGQHNSCDEDNALDALAAQVTAWNLDASKTESEQCSLKDGAVLDENDKEIDVPKSTQAKSPIFAEKMWPHLFVMMNPSDFDIVHPLFAKSSEMHKSRRDEINFMANQNVVLGDNNGSGLTVAWLHDNIIKIEVFSNGEEKVSLVFSPSMWAHIV